MIGDNIKKFRTEKKMTQGKLLEEIKKINNGKTYTQVSVSTWEKNKVEVPVGAIKLIAKALRCEESDLTYPQSIDELIEEKIKKKVLDGTIGGNIQLLRLKQGMSRAEVALN